MLESRTESSKESSRNLSTPKIRPLNVTSISSAPAPRSPSADKNPLRQDSYFSTQSDGSEVDGEIQARQTRARERVIILRGRVSRTRRQKKTRRYEFMRLRDNLRDATDKLMRKVNEIAAFDTVREGLVPYFDQLRDAQDALGPAEDAYDQLENRLEEEEQDLEQEEIHFYRHHEVSVVSVPESNVDVPISPLVKPYAPENEVQEQPLEEGLVQEYLERVAEAKRLRNELDGLEEEYFRISTDASFRNRYDIPLSTETAKFLDEYRSTHADIRNTLYDVETDVFDLRDRCVKGGLFSEAEYVYEPRDALCEDVMDTVYEVEDRSPLRMAALRIDFHDEEVDYENKKQYINNWLFQLTKNSQYECLVLKRWILSEYPGEIDHEEELVIDKWSDLALEYWDTDGAGEYTDKFYSASMLDAIAGDTGRFNATIIGRSGVSDSLRSLDVYLDDIEKLEEITTGSYDELPVKPNLQKRRSSSVPLRALPKIAPASLKPTSMCSEHCFAILQVAAYIYPRSSNLPLNTGVNRSPQPDKALLQKIKELGNGCFVFSEHKSGSPCSKTTGALAQPSLVESQYLQHKELPNLPEDGSDTSAEPQQSLGDSLVTFYSSSPEPESEMMNQLSTMTQELSLTSVSAQPVPFIEVDDKTMKEKTVIGARKGMTTAVGAVLSSEQDSFSGTPRAHTLKRVKRNR
ncbi:hypothetical protein G7Y89_g7988 [Cudoniella acicularis]|uniref:Uncharacterized protein n=1 Tax=Cudoniella acicularis TaxID=354080 RepID=A0A8H4RJG8_9HELO|nr:hypothetical protein G7Y89_g7988 [Cudoniella acicularis]